LSEQLALEVPDVQTTWWRCARCFCRGREAVTWLWRNDTYGTALVKCSCCGWHWQEPGWQFVEGAWVDTHVALYGRHDPDEGCAIWSNPNPLRPCLKAQAAAPLSVRPAHEIVAAEGMAFGTGILKAIGVSLAHGVLAGGDKLEMGGVDAPPVDAL
jgi:hypothetical protein